MLPRDSCRPLLLRGAAILFALSVALFVGAAAQISAQSALAPTKGSAVQKGAYPPISQIGGGSGRPTPAEIALFISSDPIGAVVVLDGKTILSRTPLLLRNLRPGKHRIEIARKGYLPYLGSVTVSSEKPTTFEKTLTPSLFDPRFNGNRKVLINGADYGGFQYRLRAGTYQIGDRGGALAIDTVFPAQQILSVVDLTTGALLITSAILIAEAILEPTGSSGSGSSGNNLGGYIPVWIATGVSAVSDISLHVQKHRYLGAYGAAVEPSSAGSAAAQRLYQQAQDRLVSGDLQRAAELYIQIIRGYPESLSYPRALYRLAKIQAIQGDDLLATTELKIILDRYPLPDLYDKTCKTLADLSYRSGNYRLALAYLDKMVFLDPLFPRSQINQFRSQIEKGMKGDGT